MFVRTQWRIFEKVSVWANPPRPSPTKIRLLAALLTAVCLFWLLIHYISPPAWLFPLPPLLNELLWLIEVAAIASLLILWLLLYWQWRQPATAVPLPTLTIDELYALSPYEFEQYVADLFRRKGYQVSLRGRSGDNGVDLLITDRQGKRAIVQCKRYRKTISPDVVRELYGTLMHERVAHAFLVSTASISNSAREWAQGKPMTLIDGRALVQVAQTLNRLPD